MGALAKLQEIFRVGDELDYDEMEEMEEMESEMDNASSSGGLRILRDNQPKQRAVESTSLAKVVVFEPFEYKDATNVIDSLKNNKIVIMKLESVKEKNDMSSIQVKQQIFECINGAVYALEGTIEKLSETIFLLAPKDVDVDATTLETSYNSAYISKWDR